MTLYSYFEQADSVLPTLHSSLSTASTIAAINEAVKKIIDSDTGPNEEDTTCSSRCRAYEHFTLKGQLALGEGSGAQCNSYHNLDINLNQTDIQYMSLLP